MFVRGVEFGISCCYGSGDELTGFAFIAEAALGPIWCLLISRVPFRVY